MSNVTRVAASMPRVEVVDAPVGIDPLLVLAGSQQRRRFYWEVPSEGRAIVGLGEAAVIEAGPGAGRFSRVAAQLDVFAARGLAAEAVLVGGFSFDDACSAREAAPGGQPTSPSWDAFGPGRLVLPEITVVLDPGRSRVVTAGTDLGSAALPQAEPAVLSAPHRLAPSGDLASDGAYLTMVDAAVRSIEDGRFAKVVCARTVRLRGSVAVAAALDALRQRNPGCAVFAVAEGDEVFFGATPEVLLSRRGDTVATAAVAGTRPRGVDEAGDTAMAGSLLTDPKELAEHRFVLEQIRRELAAGGVALDPVPPTEVIRLRHVQHLRTPVTGRLSPSTPGLVELAGRLHPTPAVAGTPTAEARAFLTEWETFERGWYAAPVGWVDGAGDGELRVALRCGLVDAAGVTLYAGAGVVRGSDPGRELDETTAKLQALAQPLLGP